MSRGGPMRLTVRTPAHLLVDTHVRGVIAEDGSGRFGIRPGCEPHLAALIPSLLTYRQDDGTETLVAVGSGVLDADGVEVKVAVRAAVVCTALEQVRAEVLRAQRAERQGEATIKKAFRALDDRLREAILEEERGP